MLRELVGLLVACFKKLLAQPAFWSATERVVYAIKLLVSDLSRQNPRNVFRNGYFASVCLFWPCNVPQDYQPLQTVLPSEGPEPSDSSVKLNATENLCPGRGSIC